MKIVINKCFGGFGLSDFALEKLTKNEWYYEDNRTDAELIGILGQYPTEKINGRFAELEIVELPENCTDYYIDEYDGLETLIYVVNGKLHFA